eukprot:TRINITY_DN3401_c0_g1_i6.p1 TRINITY_DN3401_c0_g1~~TRINITY_DN3401_c0_g1_i6.p1  ORF type:complete len:2375 (+),score=806.44 TRINITY_DN3401_c0_g1_i6:420-7127(+)
MEEETSGQRETIEDLERELDQTKQELKEYQERVGSQQSKLAHSLRDDKDLRVQVELQKETIKQQLAEIQDLATQNKSLRGQMLQTAEDTDILVVDSENTKSEILRAHDELHQEKQKNINLQHENNQLKAKVTELQNQLGQADKANEQFFGDVNKKLSEYKQTVESRNAQIEQKNKEISTLKRQIPTSRNNQLVATIESLKATLQERDKTIDELNTKNNALQEDFTLLSIELKRVEDEMAGQKGKSVAPRRGGSGAPQTEHEKKLTEELARQRREAEELTVKLKDLERLGEDKVNAEIKRGADDHMELVELRAKMKRIEKGVDGLADANEEIRVLKNNVKCRDIDITQYTGEINQKLKLIDDLQEENQLLRARLGVESPSPADLAKSKFTGRLEKERLKALNGELKRENEKQVEEIQGLREELDNATIELNRVKRLQALEDADRAVKVGLTYADQRKVDRFAQSLKGSGREDGAYPVVTDLSGIEDRPKSDLVRELREARVALDDARGRLALLRSERDEMQAELARTAASSALSRVPLQTVFEENNRLKNFISDYLEHQPSSDKDFAAAVKQLSGSLVKQHEALMGTLQAPSAQQQHADSALATKLIEELQQQKKMLQDDVSGKAVQLECARVEAERRNARIRELETTAARNEKAREQQKQRIQTILPSEILEGCENVDAVATLNSQLIECLEALEKKEEELSVLSSKVLQFEEKFMIAEEQVKLLYVEHTEAQGRFDEERERMQKQHQKMADECENSRLRVAEYERGASGAGSSEVILLRVNAGVAARGLAASERELQAERQALVELRGLSNKMELTLRERVVFLQNINSSLAAKVGQLQQELERSVPKSDYELLSKKYVLLSQCHEEVLLQEKVLIQERSEDTNMSPAMMKQRMSELELELKLEQEKSAKLKSLAGGSRGVKGPDYNEKIVALTMAEENANKRLLLCRGQLQAATDAQTQMESRINKLEAETIRLSKEKRRLQDKLLAVGAEYQDSVKRDVAEQLTRQIEQQEETIVKLNAEVTKFRELTDIAVEQCNRSKARRAAESNEVELLRGTVAMLQSKSDNAAMISQLHHRIRVLQAKEITNAQKIDEQDVALHRFRVMQNMLEQQLHDKLQALYMTREVYRKRVRELLDMLNQAVAKETSVNKLQELLSALRELRAKKHDLEEANSALAEKLAVLESELEQHRIGAEAATGGSSAGGSVGSVALRQELAGLRRQAQLSKDREKALRRAAREAEEVVERLEDQLVRDEQAWEQRYQQQVERARELQAQQLDDQSYVDASRLAEDTRRIDAIIAPAKVEDQRRSQAAAEAQGLQPKADDATREIALLKETVAQLTAKAKNYEETLMEKETQLTELQLDRMCTSPGLAATAEAQTSAARAATFSRPIETRTLVDMYKVAQETICTYQETIQKKDEALTKFQKQLVADREEHFVDTQALQKEIAQLNEKLRRQDAAASAALRAEATLPLELPATIEKVLPLEEVNKMIIRKDAQLKQLGAQLEQWQEEVAAARAQATKAEGRLLEGQKAADELKRLIAGLDANTEQLQRDARDAAQRAEHVEIEKEQQMRELQTQIEALRNQLSLEKGRSLMLDLERKTAVHQTASMAQQEACSDKEKPRAPRSRSSTPRKLSPSSTATAASAVSAKLMKQLKAQVTLKDKQIETLEQSVTSLKERLAEQQAIYSRKTEPKPGKPKKPFMKQDMDELKQLREMKEKYVRSEEDLRKTVQLQNDLNNTRGQLDKIRIEMEYTKRMLADSQARTMKLQVELDDARRQSALPNTAQVEKLEKRIKVLNTQLTEARMKSEAMGKLREKDTPRKPPEEGEPAIVTPLVASAAKSDAAVAAEKSQLEKQIDQLQERLTVRNSEVARMEKVMVEFKAKYDKMARDFDALAKRYQEADQERGSLSSTLQDTQEQLSLDNTERDKLLAQRDATIQSLEHDVQQLKQQLLQKKKGSDALRDTEAKLAAVSTENDALRRKATLEEKDLSGTVEKLKQVVDSQQAELASLKKSTTNMVPNVKYMELVREHKAAKQQLDAIKESSVESAKREGKASKTIDDVLKMNRRLEEENRTLRAKQATDHSAELSKLTKHCKELETRVDELEPASKKKDTEIERQRIIVGELKAQVSKLTKQAQQLQYQQVQLQQSWGANTQDGLNRQMTQMTQEFQELERSYKHLLEENAGLKDELAAINPSFYAEIVKLQANYKDVLRKNKALEDKLQKLAAQYHFSL